MMIRSEDAVVLVWLGEHRGVAEHGDIGAGSSPTAKAVCVFRLMQCPLIRGIDAWRLATFLLPRRSHCRAYRVQARYIVLGDRVM